MSVAAFQLAYIRQSENHYANLASVTRYQLVATDQHLSPVDVQQNISTPYLLRCATACSNNQICQSFSYNENMTMCELHARPIILGSGLVSAPGYKTFEVPRSTFFFF